MLYGIWPFLYRELGVYFLENRLILTARALATGSFADREQPPVRVSSPTSMVRISLGFIRRYRACDWLPGSQGTRSAVQHL